MSIWGTTQVYDEALGQDLSQHAAEARHHVPALIIEYVTEETFPEVRDFLRSVIAVNA